MLKVGVNTFSSRTLLVYTDNVTLAARNIVNYVVACIYACFACRALPCVN